MKVTRKAGKIEALRAAIDGLNGAEGKVGWFASAVYEKGQPVAGVAAVQEFGSPSRGIPPRLGMRQLAIEKHEEWKHLVEGISKAVARGDMAPDSVMDAITMAAEGHMRAHITQVNSPPLKTSTVAARKRRLANGGKGAQSTIAKPLVDTGILLTTLSSEVTKK